MTLAAGYGERNITPPFGLDLCGYGFYLERRAERVLDDLKVRVLWLNSNGRTLILAVCDLIGLAVEYSDRLRADIAAAHRLPVSHVLLACTHTHSGPATQPLPGLGDVNAAYLEDVRKAVLEAVGDAAGAANDAVFGAAFETIEPIGYNRRTNDFREIDPVLKVGVFKGKSHRVLLFNYACHAVVLGPQKNVSADWPGAVIRKVKASGDRAVFLQGFSGDIDPVTQLNRWGRGTADDLALYGNLVARRIAKATEYAETSGSVALGAAESRVALPLRVYGKREIERGAAGFAKRNAHFPGAAKFAAEWEKTALAEYQKRRKSPWLGNVPVQALSCGGLKILALPGEVFCRLGLRAWATLGPLMTAGYANGSVGYIPTRKAYEDPNDYACWCAPMFYQTFPFTPDIERILMRESLRLLAAT